MTASIEENIACAGCGYSLRTLSTAGRCPECGMGVLETLAQRLPWESPLWRTELKRAFGFLLVGSWLFIGGVLATIFILPVGLMVIPVAVMIHVIGAKRLAGCLPDGKGNPERRIAFVGTAAVALVVWLLFSFVFWLAMQHTRAGDDFGTVSLVVTMVLSLGAGSYLYVLGGALGRFMQLSGARGYARWSVWAGRTMSPVLSLTIIGVAVSFLVGPVVMGGWEVALGVGMWVLALGFLSGAVVISMMVRWVDRRSETASYLF